MSPQTAREKRSKRQSLLCFDACSALVYIRMWVPKRFDIHDTGLLRLTPLLQLNLADRFVSGNFAVGNVKIIDFIGIHQNDNNIGFLALFLDIIKVSCD